ncbi:MAG: ATP-dependent 6-phosphofructokinase [Phycisphaerae bacterium]|nr:ATP-dependent 6-phosphofructokinase [Phycisphaerae bacterium]
MDFKILTLGQALIRSPIDLSARDHTDRSDYVRDDQGILYDISADVCSRCKGQSRGDVLELAGPREKIYFEPSQVHAAIVTCGGLSPGLNDVIRAIVMCLWYRYGVQKISGVRFGYRGFLPEFGLSLMELKPTIVEDIHDEGGTLLGSSRGYGDRLSDIIECICRNKINMLFTIGGDGTQKGAQRIGEEIRRRGLKIAVVGIPKTIDNDLSFMEKSFGFETAVSKAVEAVQGAHVEAHDTIRGVGIVKLMGRQSGFIAAHAALGSSDVNFVLVPEVPFDLDGPNGLLTHLDLRLDRRNHAVIVVAEGAGQDLFVDDSQTDASGNKKLHDIGIFLRDRIQDHYAAQKREVNVKYIDPSYIIRSLAANPSDSIFCARLGSNAVHAAMAGKTEILISQVHGQLVHVPIQLAVSRRNFIDPEGPLWRDVIDATGQPRSMKNF